MITSVMMSLSYTLLATSQVKPADPIDLLREAAEASVRGLNSAVAKGTFRCSERAADDREWQIISDATVQVSFDRGQYHLEFNYSKERLGTKRRIVIYDGSAILASDFSDNIHPTGSHGQVWAGEKPGRAARPQSIDFPWDVSRLAYGLLNLPALVANISREAITVTELENGNYILKYRMKNSPNVIGVYEFSKAYGFNVTSAKTVTDSDPTPYRTTVATWKNSKGIWYIDDIVEDLTVRGSKGKSHRWELKYHDVEVNAKVSSKLFTMAALKLHGGSRIMDHRPDTTEQFHYVPVEDKVIEEKLDNMAEQLKALPTQPSGALLPVGQKGTAVWWYWFIGVNAVLVALFVGILRLRRRKKTTT